ncbi:MAG: ARMT1-like domain-containing protein [Candidatus Omnitrophica bacterium]|nr:ARMT1-like domain-containing protein [Candidatus Omnitrophota bacterium]
MKTYPECMDCFIRQAGDASDLIGSSPSVRKAVIDEVRTILASFPEGTTPPEIARAVYGIVGARCGGGDPYAKIKRKSNILAMELYPSLKKTIRGSRDPLLAAVRIAVAGNVIDYGVPHAFDIEEEVEECLDKPFAFLDYEHFRKDASAARSILYILDNAGEIVFDRMLIEELGPERVTAAVRSKAIINDVTMEDAVFTGLVGITRVIESGSTVPGTVIGETLPEFRELFETADLVISKGQGNYETLSDSSRPIYFIFKAKCPVVAGHAGCKLGDIILKKMG